MRNCYIQRAFYILLLIALGMLARVSVATNVENHKVVDGVAIYVGIMPAEMIQGHPQEHAEREMHGGVPSGAHRDHLIVALFDNATGKRISDVQVTATVEEIGLAGKTKKLEPMKIAGTITYGNYFDMPSRNIYRILVQIRRPESAGAIKAEFTHRHYPN